MPARITILRFRFNERSESKFWSHGITRDQVEELLNNRWIAGPNRKHRIANHLVIGRDDNGRCIVVPVVPTEDPAIWRPITAWYCKPSEASKLR